MLFNGIMLLCNIMFLACYLNNMQGTGNDPQCAHFSALYITLPPTVSEHTLFSCANIVLAQMLYNMQSVNATAGVKVKLATLFRYHENLDLLILTQFYTSATAFPHSRLTLALILPGFFLFDLCCTV